MRKMRTICCILSLIELNASQVENHANHKQIAHLSHMATCNEPASAFWAQRISTFNSLTELCCDVATLLSWAYLEIQLIRLWVKKILSLFLLPYFYYNNFTFLIISLSNFPVSFQVLLSLVLDLWWLFRTLFVFPWGLDCYCPISVKMIYISCRIDLYFGIKNLHL